MLARKVTADQDLVDFFQVAEVDSNVPKKLSTELTAHEFLAADVTVTPFHVCA